MAHIEVYLERRRKVVGRKQYRWRVVARNGRIMATGAEGYNNLSDLWNAVNEVNLCLGEGLQKPVPIHERKPRNAQT